MPRVSKLASAGAAHGNFQYKGSLLGLERNHQNRRILGHLHHVLFATNNRWKRYVDRFSGDELFYITGDDIGDFTNRVADVGAQLGKVFLHERVDNTQGRVGRKTDDYRSANAAGQAYHSGNILGIHFG